MVKKTSSLALLSTLFVASVWGQALPDENEIQGRGFSAEKVYQLHDLDTVDLFSGSLSLAIPIGPRYTVNGALSYRFNLAWTSAVWTYRFIDSSPDPPEYEAVPNSLANGGLGWMVTFGYLIPPGHDPLNTSTINWLYVSPDGANHYLWDVLHVEEGPTPPDPDPGVWYSRDNTYIRLSENVQQGVHELELPNGEIHRFEQGVHDPTVWELTQIRDRFGNWVDVVRSPVNSWTIEDSEGRQHSIEFETSGGSGLPRPRIASISPEAPGGQTAVYDFEYAVRTVERGCRDTHNPSGSTVQVPLLLSMDLPLASGERFFFGDGSNPPNPDYGLACGGSTGGPTGRLLSMTLPTMGRVEWEWGRGSASGRRSRGRFRTTPGMPAS